MLIEFYGPPASGKTTLARALSARGVRRIRIRSRLALLGYNLRFFARSPLRLLRSLGYALFSGGPLTLRYYKLMNLLQYNARWEKAHAVSIQSGEPVILDQGHRQNLLTFFDRQLAPEEVRDFLSLCPPVDELVVFDAPQADRQHRLHKRGYVGLRERMGKEARARWEGAYEANHRTMLSVLPDDSYTAIRSEKDTEALITKLS